MPSNGIIIKRSRDDILIPVSVHICHIDKFCSICACSYNSFSPTRICSPIVLIPSYGVIIIRSRSDIHIPISIYICCKCINCIIRICVYVCSCPCRICSSIIFIPSNSVVITRSRYDIHVPVSIHVCCEDTFCAICSCCDISSGPSGVCSPVVLIPSYGIIKARSR